MNRHSPLDAAIEATKTMVDVSAQHRILEEVAKVRFHSGRLEDALLGIVNLPSEKAILRQLAIDAANKNDADSVLTVLRCLIVLDPESASLAGRLATLLLDHGNSDGAMKIIRNIDQPFEGDRARYDCIVKFLERDRFDDVRKLTEAFKEVAFCDWVHLASIKRNAVLGRFDEVERIVNQLSTPEKRAWAFFESSRLSDPATTLLRRAAMVLATLDVDKVNAETVAVQRRIVGKALWNADETETARQLLESAEAALSLIENLFQRLRAQCFLAKVLRQVGELDSVRHYINVSTLTVALFTPRELSELLQWLAEASGQADDWTLAVQAAANDKDERRRSRRIVDILRRFAHSSEKPSPTGDPDLDAVLLSGEEFEERYASPFSIDGCNC